MIHAVIFDVDGLLLDTEPLWDKTDAILLQRRGFTPDKHLFLQRRGTGHKKTLEIYKDRFGMNEDIDSLINERLDIFYNVSSKELMLMEGAWKLIKSMHTYGFPLAIATGGYSEKRISEILNQFKLGSYFPVIVCNEHVQKHKPNPDIFLLAAKKLGVEPNVCLVLEDAPNGVIAGKAAGMLTYGINSDPEVYKKLQEAEADKVFVSLSEIDIPSLVLKD